MHRVSKEIRLLLLPAGLVCTGLTAALLLSLTAALPQLHGPVLLVTMFLGIPLLAASSFGAEFHHRTMPLLLAQPLARRRILLEKWVPLLAAIMVFGAVFVFLMRGLKVAYFPPVSALLYLTAVACSAPLWTLIARSTIGGAAFTIASLLMLELGAAFGLRWMGLGDMGEIFASTTPGMATVRLTYSALAAAAGWFVFNRLQVSGDAHVSSGTLGGVLGRGAWLRPRRGRPVANLFRKELRLQFPALVIAAIFCAIWLIVVAAFAISPPRIQVGAATFIILLALYLPLTVVLVGTVSFSEDQSLGIHAWHLTFPVRPVLHWAVKLATTLLVGGTLLIALPLALHALTLLILGPDGWVPELPRRADPPLVAWAGAILLCFWCASLFGHPVRAAVAATLIGLGAAATASLAAEVSGQLDVMDSLLTWVMVKQQLPPDFFVKPLIDSRTPMRWADYIVAWLVVVMYALVVVLSLRAFRRGRVDRPLIVRQVAALLLYVTVAAGIGYSGLYAAFGLVYQSAPIRELEAALVATALPSMDSGPQQVALESIAPRLSPRTLEWLENSDIQVVRARRTLVPGRRYRAVYRFTITFPGGREFHRLYFGAVDARQ